MMCAMHRAARRVAALLLLVAVSAGLAACDTSLGPSTNNAYQKVSNSIP
jgi:predicted small secreted protein